MNTIDPVIANQALKLALEWGPDLGKPLPPRLALLQPTLTPAERDDYSALANAASKAGFAIMYELAEKLGHNSPTIAADLRAQLLKSHPWLDDANLNSIYNQGMYYTWHDGVGM